MSWLTNDASKSMEAIFSPDYASLHVSVRET